MRPLYRLDGIVQRFGDKEALAIPGLSLKEGMIYVLQGPNGAGKTTLMRLLAFLDTPSEGSIRFRDETVRPEQAARFRARVVWVPQSPIMFTGTLLYNVEYPMRLKKVPGKERRRKALALLESMDMGRLAGAPAHKLSGGESQRASIARALAAGAEVLLFDEPTASVDFRSRGEIIDVIRRLCADRGFSVIVTTHDAALAEVLGHKRITLFDGRLVPHAPGYPAGNSVLGTNCPTFHDHHHPGRHPGRESTMSSITTDSPAECIHKIHIDEADSALCMLLQTGVEVACTTGIPLADLLCKELGLNEKQMAALDVFLLDGKPVDSPKTTPVPANSRLALAAGLPGIAGLAMRSDSAVKGLRPGITHAAAPVASGDTTPRSGTIELVLYSLALKHLAPHILAQGCRLRAAKLLEIIQTGIQGAYSLDGNAIERDALLERLAVLPAESIVCLSAKTRPPSSPTQNAV